MVALLSVRSLETRSVHFAFLRECRRIDAGIELCSLHQKSCDSVIFSFAISDFGQFEWFGFTHVFYAYDDRLQTDSFIG